MTPAPDISSDVPTRVINGFTTIWGVTVNPMAVLLAVLVLAILVILYRAHRAAKFDVWDLLKDGGKPSWTRSVGLAAFLMTTWVIIDREIKGTLTVEFFAGYGVMWVAPIITRIAKGVGDVPSEGSKP